jgi:hypothetical protein
MSIERADSRVSYSSGSVLALYAASRGSSGSSAPSCQTGPRCSSRSAIGPAACSGPFPVALLELGDRQFLQASYGEVNSVRNLGAPSSRDLWRSAEADDGLLPYVRRGHRVGRALRMQDPILADVHPFRPTEVIGHRLPCALWSTCLDRFEDRLVAVL